MLLKVLRALQHGGTHRLRDLAKELGVSSELLESILDELVRSGYARRVDAACATSCAACCESALCVTACRRLESLLPKASVSPEARRASGAATASRASGTGSRGRLWTLTERGQNAAQRT